MSTPTLVFVYNAPDGIGAALFDAVHKAVSPSTYPCSLCAVTYGAVAMKREWRAWLKALPIPTRFLHRDGFRRAYPKLEVALPVVLLDANGTPRPLLSAEELNALPDLTTLMATLEARLAAATPPIVIPATAGIQSG
jgi:hypothetical protein